MSRKVPWDVIQEGGGKDILPEGKIKFKIEEMVEGVSKSSGKFMVTCHLRATAPKRVANLLFVEYFTLGSDADKNADDPKTWHDSKGATRWSRMLRKAGVTRGETIAKTAKNAEGHEFVGEITQELEESNDPRFKDQTKNRLTRFYAVGEVEPQLNDEIAAAAQAAAEARRAAAVQPATVVDEDDEN